jgi:hypothetical protein
MRRFILKSGSLGGPLLQRLFIVGPLEEGSHMLRRTDMLMHAKPMGRMLAVGAVILAAPMALQADTTVMGVLSSFQEVPSVSSSASGTFRAKIDEAAETISWELSYTGISTAVQQAHIHFGQSGVNGGVSAFLCTNLGNGPVGTLACPQGGGDLSGVITPTSVVGPGVQGITAGEFAELVAAIRSGVAYANVHSAAFPGGEIRAQIK